MVCKQCSQLIPDESLFCPYCGVKIESSVSVDKSADLPVSKPKKKGKPVLVVLLILVLLVGVAGGYYYHSYTQAKSHALVGNFTKADSLLIARPITRLHDPQLLAYEDAGLTALSGDYQTAEKQYQALADQDYADSEVRVLWCRYNEAKELFETDKLNGYLKMLELEATGYISTEVVENYRNNLYSYAVDLYHDGDRYSPKPIFEELKNYKRSEDYLTLVNRRSYDKMFDIVPFEDSSRIIEKYYMEKFLIGTWKSVQGDYYFSIVKNANDGSYNASYNLPLDVYGSATYEFSGNVFVLRKTVDSSQHNVYRFTILSKNKVYAYCYSNGMRYELNRQ